MAVTVRIPTQLRPPRGRAAARSASRAPPSAEVLKALDAAHPGFADRLFDDSGQLRRFVNVFVADEDIRFLDGVDTPVPDGATALDRAGGRRRLTAVRAGPCSARAEAGRGFPGPAVALTLRRRLTVSTRDVRVLIVVRPTEGTKHRCPS